MDILFVTPEVVPFSKVGALGDVIGALPKALRALGHRVHVLSLLYSTVDPNGNALARRLTRVQVPLGTETISAEVYEARLPSGVQVTLLNAPGLTDRPNVYGEPDDHRRFAFLARGAIEWMRIQPKIPDVVHAHDWTGGLVPYYLKACVEADPRLEKVKTVFTIHNLAHLGIFPKNTLAEIGVTDSPAFDLDGSVSWMKAGVALADKVTTVSPSYAREITSPSAGEQLASALNARGKDLVGILNGVDFAVWNPSTDPHLIARYDAEDTTAKDRCKSDLAMRAEISPRLDVPLFGWVGRFDRQKGFDLLLDAAPRWIRQDLQMVLLGEGEADLTESALELARRFPDRVFVKNGFDEALAHKIYAGSDFFLAPSRFEPSGLSALYAMRYGTVPVARATGGLRDGVLDCDNELETGTGFLFEQSDSDDFYSAMARALSAFANRDALRRLSHRVMRKDLSWERSARQYQALFTAIVEPTESIQANP